METMESAIFAVFADYSAISNNGRRDGTMETMESAIFAVFADYSVIFAIFGPSRLYWRCSALHRPIFSLCKHDFRSKVHKLRCSKYL